MYAFVCTFVSTQSCVLMCLSLCVCKDMCLCVHVLGCSCIPVYVYVCVYMKVCIMGVFMFRGENCGALLMHPGQHNFYITVLTMYVAICVSFFFSFSLFTLLCLLLSFFEGRHYSHATWQVPKQCLRIYHLRPERPLVNNELRLIYQLGAFCIISLLYTQFLLPSLSLGQHYCPNNKCTLLIFPTWETINASMREDQASTF